MLHAIVLTYDDGPSEVLTQTIIQLLEANKMKATFFMLGHKLQQNEEIVSALLAAGHEVGSHSYWHLNAWCRSPLAVFRDVEQGLAAAGKLGATSLFRPPHGKITLASILQVLIRKLTLAWWTIDSSDTWVNPIPVEQIIDQIRREGGGVILMHDHERVNDPERKDYVITLTKMIIRFARTEGYKIVPFGELYSAYD